MSCCRFSGAEDDPGRPAPRLMRAVDAHVEEQEVESSRADMGIADPVLLQAG